MAIASELSGDLIANRKVLVTGGAGLLGNELLKQLLNEGYNVTAIYHSSLVTLTHPNLNIQQCDILDVSALEDVMQGTTDVYHCAAIVSFEPGDQGHLFKINVEGTENIVNACVAANVRKLLHVSSVAALGRIRKGEVITEDMQWTEETSNSIYAKSKYFGELEVWRGIGEGLQAVIVNPSIILGGDNWESGSSALFKSAYNEFKWYTEGISGFVDVRDVAQAMILLMNSKISGQRFILSAENLSYKEIFSLMAKSFGKKPPPNKVSPAMAEIIWRVEALKGMITRKKRLLTKETARTAQAAVYYDHSKILNALPTFHFTPISDTIDFTSESLKKRYNL
jgi:dihydroflavonol-4-reductase